MKILLTGAAGQLGVELRPVLEGFGQLVSVDRVAPANELQAVCLDLGDFGRLEALLEKLRPDLVVNAAAYTAVDQAESEAESAFRINAELPACLARWAFHSGSLVVHYSTDYVFPGESDRPYRETDPTGPLNVYGESKLAGEVEIAATGCRHLLLRTSWVYSSHGNNFVRTMVRLARERDSLSVVDDQVGRPTWARNLARVSGDLLARVRQQPAESELLGTWHYCDNGTVSWYDFALAIFREAQANGMLERIPKVQGVSSQEYPQAAQRPRYSVLDTAAISTRFGIVPAALEASLEACLEEMRTHEQS